MKVLRQWNFTVLFSGQVLSTVGNHLFGIALLWYVLTATGSRLDVSLAGIMQTLPGIAALFTGVYVDRWRKRQTMMISDGLRAVIALGLFLSVTGSHTDLPLILVLVLLLEFFGTFFRPAASAFLPQVVAKDDLPGAVGVFQSSAAGAQLVGLAGGGALIGLIGVPIIFLVNALTFVASVIGVGLVRVRETAIPRRAHSVSFFREWIDGLGVIFRSRLLLRIVVAALLTNFALAPLDVLFPFWVRSELHGSSVQLGLLMGALVVGLLVGGLLVGAVAARWSIRPILRATLLLVGLAMVGLGAVPNLAWDLTVGFLLGSAAGVATGALTSLLLQKVPADSRGRVFGAMNALATAATPLGIAAAAALTYLPLPLLFAGFGAVALAAAFTFFLPARDDLSSLETA